MLNGMDQVLNFHWIVIVSLYVLESTLFRKKSGANPGFIFKSMGSTILQRCAAESLEQRKFKPQNLAQAGRAQGTFLDPT